MTRAKDHLHIIVPQRFYTHQQASRGDRHVYASRTRFVPASILSHFEGRTWPVAAASAGAGSAAQPQYRVDIAARMRGMWR
jgi:DNA helicase-2/ATP-dependent DNA helicase PcrA